MDPMMQDEKDDMMTSPMTDEKEQQEGGRRRQKKTRKVNSALKSWVAFVKKVQHEEKISYPDAMKRASKRKSEWKRGGMPMKAQQMGGVTTPLAPADVTEGYEIRSGGRRRTKRRGSKKRRSYRRR
jgi:hypothetical protein